MAALRANDVARDTHLRRFPGAPLREAHSLARRGPQFAYSFGSYMIKWSRLSGFHLMSILAGAANRWGNKPADQPANS